MASAATRRSAKDLDEQVAAVRRFNRFYTREIGTLNEGLLESRFSLTEVRVLYELAHGEKLTATDIRRELGLDNGYLSRMLARFEKAGLVRRETSGEDARQAFVALTARGRKEFAVLDRRQDEAVRKMLEKVPAGEQPRLVAAMETVAGLLSERPTLVRQERANEDGAPSRASSRSQAPAPYVLRGPRAGDLGWVVERHGAIYTQEHGWDWRFEALVARICADFVDHFDAKRERCWIAERDGQNIGCVFLVKHPELADTAKLRMLLVEPSARGMGLGKRLVDECTRFARAARYKNIMLWTNSSLHTARHIYEQAGYKKTHEQPDPLFHPDEMAQTWELEL